MRRHGRCNSRSKERARLGRSGRGSLRIEKDSPLAIGLASKGWKPPHSDDMLAAGITRWTVYGGGMPVPRPALLNNEGWLNRGWQGEGRLPDGALAARFRRISGGSWAFYVARPFHSRSATRSSTTVRLAIARTNENTSVYLPSTDASPFIFSSEAFGKRRTPLVIL